MGGNLTESDMDLQTVLKPAAILGFALLFGSAAVQAQEESNSINRVVYNCARNIAFSVVYVNSPDSEPYAIFAIDDRLVLAKIAPSGSGALYVSDDKSLGYHWHTKGPEGQLYFSAGDPAGQEDFILRDCIEVNR